MDIQKQKQRKQIIIIIVAFAVALPFLIWQLMPRGQGGGETQPQPQPPAQETGAEATTPSPAGPGAGPPPIAAPPSTGLTPTATQPFAPSAGPAPAGPMLTGAQPILAYRGDPFGLGAVLSAGPVLPRESQEQLLRRAIFSPGSWGVAERPGVTTVGGMSRGVPGAPLLAEVRISPLNVASRPVVPIPGIAPKLAYQYAPLPGSPEELVATGVEIPTAALPAIEGMRLSGIVRTGYPRGILEWKTPQGRIVSQVIAPNQPLLWQEGARVVRIGSDYAVIKDAAGKTWRVPLKW